MKMHEIRERSDSELQTLSRQLREDLYKLRVQKATNQLEKTNELGRTRKDLARVLTVIEARRRGIEAKKESAVR
jgi:large subunit ribosomal protein L29